MPVAAHAHALRVCE